MLNKGNLKFTWKTRDTCFYVYIHPGERRWKFPSCCGPGGKHPIACNYLRSRRVCFDRASPCIISIPRFRKFNQTKEKGPAPICFISNLSCYRVFDQYVRKYPRPQDAKCMKASLGFFLFHFLSYTRSSILDQL